jgi:hypothetical protein
MQEFDRNSIEASSIEKDDAPGWGGPEEKIKMISEGYVQRNKFNSGTYENVYLRLKKSVLYIYESERAERSQNTIEIGDIQEIKVPRADRPHFSICFQGLHRRKEFKVKCNDLEDRLRWVYSLDCELRRIRNDKKMKVLKVRDLTCNIIIDYHELEKGKDYFSYSHDE